MSHPFLSELARRISLHPGCRLELRRHWPAPHYHKTPQDIEEDAALVAQRQAARAAAAATRSTAGPSPPLHGTAEGGDAAEDAAFNPFDHYRVRKRTTRQKRTTKRQQREDAGSTREDTSSQAQDKATAAGGSGGVAAAPSRPHSPSAAAKRTRGNSSSSGSVKDATGKKKKKPTPSADAAATTKQKTRSEAHGSPSPSPSPPLPPSLRRTLSPHGSAVTVDAHASAMSAAAAPSNLAQAAETKALQRRIARATPQGWSEMRRAATRQERPVDREGGVRRSRTDSKSADGPNTRSSSSSSSHDGCGDDDELVPCRDPFHIRLPRHPIHSAVGGASRPLHVSVRWSGAAKRRERFLSEHQQPRHHRGVVRSDSLRGAKPVVGAAGEARGEEDGVERGTSGAGALSPPQQAAMTASSVYAAATAAARLMRSPSPHDPQWQPAATTAVAPINISGTSAGKPTRGAKSSRAVEGTVAAAATAAAAGKVSAAGSDVASSSPHPPSTVDEVSLLGGSSEPSVEALRSSSLTTAAAAAGKQQQARHRDEHRDATKVLTPSTAPLTTVRSGAYSQASAHAHAQHLADDHDPHFASYNLSSTATTNTNTTTTTTTVMSATNTTATTVTAMAAALAQLHQQHYARHPASKTATAFSQSTTATVARTSVLGMSSSELPTPCSLAEPYSAQLPPSTQGYTRRPNSLLIVRSPPQDTASDDVLATANGLYYYSSPGVYSRDGPAYGIHNSNNSNIVNAATMSGAHGLQSASATAAANAAGNSNQLRVTYVTSNGQRGSTHYHQTATSSSLDDGASLQQQQQVVASSLASSSPRPRGLAHVPRPSALTIQQHGCPDPSSSGTYSTTALHVAGTTPPTSLPSTPLQTAGQNMATYNSSGAVSRTPQHNQHGAAAAAAVVGSSPQTPPQQPLSVKTVLVQRRRSSLLRQQQQQQQQQQQRPKHPSPALFSFFPSPEAVAASIKYKSTARAATPPNQQRAVSAAASSPTGTVAFSPLDVTVSDKRTVSTNASSPMQSRGPKSVDVLESSPLPSEFAHVQRASSTTIVAMHSDPALLAALPGGCDAEMNGRLFAVAQPQRELSGLSGLGGGGKSSSSANSQRPPYPLARPSTSGHLQSHPHTEVPASVAYRRSPMTMMSHAPFAVLGDSNSNHNDDSGACSAPQHGGTLQQSTSLGTAMWMGTGETTDCRDSSVLPPQTPFGQRLLHPVQQQDHATPQTPQGRWVYARPCVYAPSESSAWVEHTRRGAGTPTAALTPVMPHHLAWAATPNLIYSEPATPMLLPQPQHQLQQQMGSAFLSPSYPQQQQQQQRLASSSMTTPYQHHLSLPQNGVAMAALSSPGTPGVYSPPRRSPSNLNAMTATTTTAPAATPAAVVTPPASPEVFCKLQRSDRQRLRRRYPLPSQMGEGGTECPGMASRLAYDAHRDAVRRGLVTQEEECSYYLSHHKYTTPLATPSDKPTPLGAAAATAARRVSVPGNSTRPLCVVSLADCTTSTASHHHKKNATTAAAANAEADERFSPNSSSSSFLPPHGSDLSESVNGPRFLFQIPRCRDDPYHRDEEALEMLSITTTSSCAFGAGLEGLCWQEWMPSSPVEAGDEVLRTLANSPAAQSRQAAAAAAAASRTSTSAPGSCSGRYVHGPQSAAAAAAAAGVHVRAGSLSNPVSRSHTGVSANGSFLVPPSAASLTPNTAAALPPGVPSAHRSPFLGSSGSGAHHVPSSLGIAAPRNSDDVCVPEVAEDHRRTQTGASSVGNANINNNGGGVGGAGGNNGLSSSASATANSSSGKRPFIAEWLVSKVQKHMEKKKLKKLRKQQEREAATVAAVHEAGGGVGGSTVNVHCPHTASSSTPATAATTGGGDLSGLERSFPFTLANRSAAGSSSPCDFSSPSTHRSNSNSSSRRSKRSAHVPSPLPPHHSSRSVDTLSPEMTEAERQQRQNRLAYLAAAYQTELVIHEQKRREAAANRRGLASLVERSRARMTPAAAAAGYYYEAQGTGVGGVAHGDAAVASPPRLLHPQGREGSQPRLLTTTTPAPPAAAAAAYPPNAVAENGAARDKARPATTYSSSSSTSSVTSDSDSSTYSSGDFSHAVVSVASPVPTEGADGNHNGGKGREAGGGAAAERRADHPPAPQKQQQPQQPQQPASPSQPPAAAGVNAGRVTPAQRGDAARGAVAPQHSPSAPHGQHHHHIHKSSKGTPRPAASNVQSPADAERRRQKSTHTRAVATERAEAERVKVALDTVHAKQRSIESWIRAMYYQH